MKKALTGQPNMMKEINRGLIKDALKKLQPATRVDLCAETKISQPTVNLIMQELLAEQVVVESGLARSKGGRKAVLYSLNTSIWYILSVVIEEHELEYTVTDLENVILEEARIEEKKGWSLETLTENIGNILKRHKDIRALAVGVPGSVSSSGVIAEIPKIAFLEEFPLKEYLKERFHLTVSVRNDINTMALGYYADHMALKESPNDSSLKDLTWIHLGDTLGAAMIINGKIVNGAGNFAGEIGFMQTGRSLRTKELYLEGLDGDEALLTVSKIMINTICLVNPAVLTISGHKLTKAAKKTLTDNCRAAIPKKMLPAIIFIEDERSYYLQGLSRVGMDSMNSDIKLIRRRDENR